MAHALGTITLSTTGLKTFNVGATSTPYFLILTVCSTTGTDTENHKSEGKAKVGYQFCQSTCGDKSRNSSAHVVRHYVAGSPTPVLEASFDSFTANGFKVNVTIASTAYQVLVDAEY